MRKSSIRSILACALCAAALAGRASQATFTQVLGDANAELKGLNGTAEADFSLPYTDGTIDVELEEGSIDIKVYDIQRFYDEDGHPSDFVTLDVICEGEGLTSGDRITFSDDDGEIFVSITSEDGATGTVTFAES